MSRFRKVLLGSAAAVAIAGGAVLVSGAGAEVAETGKLAFASPAAAHGFGWRGHRGGRHGVAMWCSDRRDGKLDRMIGFGEAFFKFDGAQKAAWQNLTTALREASADIGKRCEAVRQQDRAKTPVERLDRIEQRLAARLAIVQKVRPAFDKFYGTLSDEQKAALDRFMKHRDRRGPDRGPDRDHNRDGERH